MTHEDEYRQMHLRASEPQPRTTYIVGPPAALAAYTRLIAGDSRYLVVDSTDPVVTLRPAPTSAFAALLAPNPLAEMARAALEADDDATTHVTAYRGIDRAQFIDPIHPIPGIPAGRELTEAEATKALEAVMQERIKEALDNDIETRARIAAIPVSAFEEQIIAERGEDAIRYEGTVLGNPVVSDPSLQRTIIAAVHLTAEQIAATKHLKPGEAWAKAGQSLEPEPPAKVEDLDEF